MSEKKKQTQSKNQSQTQSQAKCKARAETQAKCKARAETQTNCKARAETQTNCKARAETQAKCKTQTHPKTLPLPQTQCTRSHITIEERQRFCTRSDLKIQRMIDRGIWRPCLATGHVYSTEKHGYLKEFTCSKGYRHTGGVLKFNVSRIIWIAAHGVPDAGMEVDHINGNKQDNRLENLQLLTKHENYQKFGCILTMQEAEDIRMAHEKGALKTHLAKLYGVSIRTVDRIIKRETYMSSPIHEQRILQMKEELKRLGTDNEAKILNEYIHGASYRQISERWHIMIMTARDIVLRGAKAKKNAASNADVLNANAQNANAQNANAQNANAQNADAQNADAQNADAQNANIPKADALNPNGGENK